MKYRIEFEGEPGKRCCLAYWNTGIFDKAQFLCSYIDDGCPGLGNPGCPAKPTDRLRQIKDLSAGIQFDDGWDDDEPTDGLRIYEIMKEYCRYNMGSDTYVERGTCACDEREQSSDKFRPTDNDPECTYEHCPFVKDALTTRPELGKEKAK